MRHLVFRRHNLRDFIRAPSLQRKKSKITALDNPFYKTKIPGEHKTFCLNSKSVMPHVNNRLVIKNLLDITI